MSFRITTILLLLVAATLALAAPAATPSVETHGAESDRPVAAEALPATPELVAVDTGEPLRLARAAQLPALRIVAPRLSGPGGAVLPDAAVQVRWLTGEAFADVFSEHPRWNAAVRALFQAAGQVNP